MTCFYTIIIPHRDIPELLKRCILSIPLRDDIQIIVIDDGSKDFEMVRSVINSLNNPTVELYRTSEGKGAGNARNIGLRHAKGKWILFADSDDVFTLNLNRILEFVKSNSLYDVVYYDVESRDSETWKLNDEAYEFSCIVKNPSLSSKYHYLVPWGKVIRHQFIVDNNISFEEVKCSNDTYFSTMLDYYSKSTFYLPVVGYCWMHRECSLWRNVNKEWYKTRIGVNSRLTVFMMNHRDDVGFNFFKSTSYELINQLQRYSLSECVCAYIKLGWRIKDIKLFFIDLPLIILHNFKEKLKSAYTK